MIHFDITKLKQQLQELESQTMKSDFWNDTINSSKVLKQINNLKNKVETFKKIDTQINNCLEMTELLKLEPEEEMAKEILKSTSILEKQMEKLEITTLLSGKYDHNNAILTIHPGAGGTEAQDWAQMLYRMYTRWANANGWEIKELDDLEGEEAG